MKPLPNFIKSRIEGKSWRDKSYVEYIEDLLRMKNWIESPPKGLCANMQFNTMKLTYEKDYLSLLKELNLEEYERQKERVFQEKKAKLAATERSKREEAQEQKEKKRQWLE